MAARYVPKPRTRKILKPRHVAPRLNTDCTNPDLSEQYDKRDETQLKKVGKNTDEMQCNIKDKVSAKVSLTMENVKQDENGFEAGGIASANAILAADQNFKRFMARLAKQLAMTFSQVTSLAAQCVKESGRPLNVFKRNKLYAKMQVACEFISKVHLELDRIIKRENDEDNIQMLLKIANIKDFAPSEELCLKYMPMVQSCKNTAESIMDSVKIMMFIIGH